MTRMIKKIKRKKKTCTELYPWPLTPPLGGARPVAASAGAEASHCRCLLMLSQFPAGEAPDMCKMHVVYVLYLLCSLCV